MKVFVLSFLIFAIFLLPIFSFGQENLLNVISSSRNKDVSLSYSDSSGKQYKRGLFAGLTMKVLFQKAEFDTKSKHLYVTGIIATSFNKTDTAGLCCISIFIAQPKNGYLTKIRFLGKTNDREKGDSSKSEGYFSFATKLTKGDRLYFATKGGSGLDEYDLGKLCGF